MSAATLEATPRPARRRVLRGLPWVTWRQHRFAVGGTLLVLGAVGAFLVVDGLAMHHAFRQLGLTNCGHLFTSACRVQLDLFQQQYQGTVDSLPRFLLLLPGLLGAFVGGPLVARELESGTYRFAWTQGRSRVRWIVAKLALLATALTALALGFSFLFTWWYGPWLTIAGRMNPSQAYEVSGLVFAARTLFAFMLGAFVGTLIRRTVPAVAATMAAWLAVVVPSMIWLRHLIEKPVTLLAATTGNSSIAIELGNANSISLGTNAPQTAWEIARWTQDAAGRHLSSSEIFALVQKANVNLGPPASGPARAVPGVGRPGDDVASFTTWLSQHGYRLGVSYQPAGRFWHFQGVEAAAYVLLALLCAAATVWWIRRRTA
jgi:ABC-type transport system involved in multi-copper enzyme maturation permease subunit